MESPLHNSEFTFDSVELADVECMDTFVLVPNVLCFEQVSWIASHSLFILESKFSSELKSSTSDDEILLRAMPIGPVHLFTSKMCISITMGIKTVSPYREFKIYYSMNLADSE